jgi:tRNA dimethylallyltransferase
MEKPRFEAEKFKIHILVGPTGVGKSEVAFHLALRMGAEILSADAFQVYRGLEVGTAQPPAEWRRQVPHHLVGTRDPRESWNVVEFAEEAAQLIERLEGDGKRVLVVGGSGFYLRALVEGAPSGRSSRPEVRAWITHRIREMGEGKALEWLRERDPGSASRLHPHDLQRICRALEKSYDPEPEERAASPLGNRSAVFWGLERPRDHLDPRLRARAQSMWKQGLLGEVRRLQQLGIPPDHPLWGAIGYQEGASFLRKEMREDQALERIFRRTRQYAKRQWTWFRHQHPVRWTDLEAFEDAAAAARYLQGEMDHHPE